MDTPRFKSRAMLRVEARIGQDLETYFEGNYATRTQTQMAGELGISGASVSRWMRDLGIETRFPGQRPQTGTAA